MAIHDLSLEIVNCDSTGGNKNILNHRKDNQKIESNEN
jgi:hypothetical protein